MPRTRRKRAQRPADDSASHLKFRIRLRAAMQIDQMIRSGKAPNCRQLAENLQVCRRTILRDIDFFRLFFNAPIAYDQRRGGYVYTQPNWVMPSVHITQGDLFALTVAEQLLLAHAAAPWARRLRDVLDRLALSLPGRIKVVPKDLAPRVSFNGDAPAIVDPAILDAAERAIRGNQRIRIEYTRLDNPTPKHYTLEPYVLRLARGAWYLAALDCRTGKVPLFHLSRIRSLQPTGETFDYDESGFDADAYFAGTFATFQSAGRHHVVIEFTGTACQLVRERMWHPSQKVTELSDGRLKFEVDVSHLYDILPWILSWGSRAVVIESPELRRLITGEVRAVDDRYSQWPGGSPA